MDVFVMVAGAVIFALIAATPDLWAALKAPRRWVPVNSAPYALSDDYHYYSVLNLFHRAFAAALTRRPELLIPLSAPSRLAIVTLLLNVGPYHIGYAIGDRRLGILFVRVWNHGLLFFAASVVCYLACRSMGFDLPIAAILLISMSHYMCYPAIFTAGWRSSILFNLHSNQHMYRYGQPNDMSRGFNLASSGGLFLLAVAWLLLPPGTIPGGPGHAALAMTWNALLFFSYLPLACVYGLLCIAHFLIDLKSVAWASAAIVLNCLCGGLYMRTAARDTVMKEVVTHRGEGAALTFSAGKLLEAAFVTSGPALIYWMTPEVSGVYLTLLVGSALWVGTIFVAKHQGSRFWDRGAILLYQLLLLTWAVTRLFDIGVLDSAGSMVALAGATAVLAVYNLRNARQLFESGSTLAPAWIADMGFLSGTTGRRQVIATDSLEIGCYAFLYTDNYALLKNYSIQSGGYKENLRQFCASFHGAGYCLQDVLDIFSTSCSYADWRDARPQYLPAGSRWLAVIHTLQFMATYREFNQGLVSDGMYDSAGWTAKMTALVAESWSRAERDASGRCQVITDPEDTVRRAISGTSNRRIRRAPQVSTDAESCDPASKES